MLPTEETQAAPLAAACLIALEDSPRKLHDDHCNAKFLAEGLARLPGIRINPQSTQTNIVVFDVSETGIATADLSAELKRLGVMINAINERQLRAVTHYDVTRDDCAQAVQAMPEAIFEAQT